MAVERGGAAGVLRRFIPLFIYLLIHLFNSCCLFVFSRRQLWKRAAWQPLATIRYGEEPRSPDGSSATSRKVLAVLGSHVWADL